MRVTFLSVLLGMSVGLNGAQAEVKFDPALKSHVQNRAEQIPVVVLLEDSSRLSSPQKYENAAVLQYLKTQSDLAWQKVESYLAADADWQEHVRNVEVHWVNNSFSAQTDAEGLRRLSRIPGVKKVYLTGEIEQHDAIDQSVTDGFTRYCGQQPDITGYPYDLKDIKLDQLTKRRDYRDVTGEGVTVGVVDTGVDSTHAYLRGKVKAFFDGRSGKTGGDAVDLSEHGTHVSGTILGGDRKDSVVGVAPGAKLVAAAALTGYPTMLKGMEFMLDPDGNPRTKDQPRAVNNSWHTGGAPDQELFYKAISAWEAAGILPVFSAGNNGPRDGTITHPKEHPATIAIGATGENGKVCDGSSRGPANFRGQEIKKPDITAPGSSITSALPRRRGSQDEKPTGKMSGTSMAAPHVTGAVALVLQVAPHLKPKALKRLLINSSVETQLDGTKPKWELFRKREWNKSYGYGKLDVWSAVRYAAREAARRDSFFRGRLRSLYSLPELATGEEAMVETEDDDSGTVAQAMQFPQELEGDEWLSADQLFN